MFKAVHQHRICAEWDSFSCMHPTGRPTHAGLEELEESEEDGYDDDNEALVEPLRQSGAQAELSSTIRRRRPGALDRYEQEVRARTFKSHTNDVTQQYCLHKLPLCVCGLC